MNNVWPGKHSNDGMLPHESARLLKTCSYCGHENSDEAVCCRECGTGFSDGSALKVVGTLQISMRQKLFLCLQAWVMATIVTASIAQSPAVLAFAHFFPVGLTRCIFTSNFQKGDIQIAALMGWLFYAVLTMTLLLQRRRIWFFILYTFLCVCLALNVTGCHLMFRQDYGKMFQPLQAAKPNR